MAADERRPSEREPGEGGGAQVPGALELTGIGIANAVCLLGGGALGWLLDSRLGTTPAFIFLGAIAGIVLGIVGTYHRVRRYLHN